MSSRKPSTDGLFANDSMIRRVNGEGGILLGGGRALLMQLANPGVAQGVAEHSNWQQNPLKRLRGTLETMSAIVFEDTETALRNAQMVQRIHSRIHGEGYDANDPALICWVNATLIDTALLFYERSVGKLTPMQREEFYQQSTQVAELLGCPRSMQPGTFAEFTDYMEDQSSSLQVNGTAQQIAQAILSVRPRSGIPLWMLPGVLLVRDVTSATLPPALATQYGLRRTTVPVTLMRTGALASQLVSPFVPRQVRNLPARVVYATA